MSATTTATDSRSDSDSAVNATLLHNDIPL